MPIRDLPNVIFDLGGVLLGWDTRAIVASVFHDPDTRDAVREAVFDHPDWLELDRGTLGEAEAISRFVQRTGQPPAMMQGLMEAARCCLAPKPESLALLEELNDYGVPLYCLSNMAARNTGYLTGRYDFFACFRDVVFSADVKMIKPERAIYEYAAARFGLSPGDCIFVDDAPNNVESARDAGWRAVRFTDAKQCRDELEALAAERQGRREDDR
jgi:putative hydrolase of the HAD superfamily